MTKIWNVSNITHMALGRSIAPGSSIKVDERLLKGAHKLNRDVAAGLLHVGDQPPASHINGLNQVRATVQAPRAHGSAQDVAPVVQAKVEAPKGNPPPIPAHKEDEDSKARRRKGQ